MSGRETEKDWRIVCAALRGRSGSRRRLGLIIVEGDAQIGDEAQDLIAVFPQAVDEVVGGGSLDAPGGCWDAGDGAG